MFNEMKTAHMAAYLLGKAGGEMRYIKLLKLLYLADRESMLQSGDSMTRDRFYSLKNGPILSQTMDILKGQQESEAWSALMERHGYEAKLAAVVDVDDLDELSPMNIDILDKVYGEFGGMEWQALCEWTHDHCGEWENPGNSRLPIEPKAIFEALGWSSEEASILDRQYAERRALERVMAQYA